MNHLQFVNQTFHQHFIDAIGYGFLSWKASIFFFFHAFFPNYLISSGSDTIAYLHHLLKKKNWNTI